MFYMLQNRPKPENKKSISEFFFDTLAILLTLAVIIFLSAKWSVLPERVPTHFNMTGEADGWGSRWTLIIMPIVGIVMWIGMYFIEKFPQSHNYLWFTEENAQRQYKNSQLLVNVMKNSILIFFSYITFNSVLIALGEQSLLGVWEIVLFLVAIFGSIAFFIYRSFRLK